MSSGIQDQISFIPEVAWGTPGVPSKSIGVHAGDGIQTDMDIRFTTAFNTTLAKNQGSFKGLAKHTGSYSMDFAPGYATYLLKGALGACASALHSGETLVSDHTMIEGTTKTPFTIEQYIDQICRRYSGAICTGFKFSQKMGEALQAEFGFIAKTQATATKITGAYDTVKVLDSNELGATGVKIGNTSFTEIQSLELEYKNGAFVDHSVSGNDPVTWGIKPSEVTFKLEAYMDTAFAVKYNTDYLTALEQALELIWTGAATIGTAAHYILDILVPKMVFTAGKYPITESHNLITLDGAASYNIATTKLIQVIVTNLIAALT